MNDAPASAAAVRARAPLPGPRDPKLRHMADTLRALAMDAVEKAKSGHPGMPMGMADIATVLFTKYLRFDPQAPDWPDRDRFVLTRQGLPLLRRGASLENLSARGAFVLAEAEGARQVTLLATGSEVSIAIAARDALAKDGVHAAVVSMPGWELFESQPKEYRDQVLGAAPGSRSRPRSNSAGSAGSAPAAPSSGCTALAPPPPAKPSSPTSALPPRGLPKPPARFYRLAKASLAIGCGRSEP